ncbi:MAG: 3-deoxy-8-phosphooctulonate synthase, partial [Verrucomicrobia bacterium]
MLFDPTRLLLIAGPCSLESDAVSNTVAENLRDLGDRLPELQIVFKGSYDKANRTSLGGARGLGIEAGLAMLGGIRERFGLPVLT